MKSAAELDRCTWPLGLILDPVFGFAMGAQDLDDAALFAFAIAPWDFAIAP
ncbi:MAG: hypothetical protein NTV57_18055 [Cyanobacteria bacterium]|nr:hypothetical protein [Cyanobacteriota bacterium]